MALEYIILIDFKFLNATSRLFQITAPEEERQTDRQTDRHTLAYTHTHRHSAHI